MANEDTVMKSFLALVISQLTTGYIIYTEGPDHTYRKVWTEKWQIAFCVRVKLYYCDAHTETHPVEWGADLAHIKGPTYMIIKLITLNENKSLKFLFDSTIGHRECDQQVQIFRLATNCCAKHLFTRLKAKLSFKCLLAGFWLTWHD